jgi:hypothetical protein
MTVEERYSWACNTPSDINVLLPLMLNYGKQCSHITEFGVRDGVSTSAWLMARPNRLVCYDVGNCPQIIAEIAFHENIDFEFHQADTAHVYIETTELLFVDTVHNGNHLLAEIGENHKAVSKFMLFHDTHKYGSFGEGNGPGLLIAIFSFLKEHEEWKIVETIFESNGLMVLGRE